MIRENIEEILKKYLATVELPKVLDEIMTEIEPIIKAFVTN